MRGLVLVFLLLAPTAAADQTFEVYATDGGDQYWFEFAGTSGMNPTLELRSGDEVRLTLTNTGNQPHNIHFGAPISRGTDYLAPGSSQTITFTVPGGLEPQTIQYWCDPHRQFGMVGDILIAGAPEAEDVPDEEAPAPFLFVALLALAAWRHRR